LGYFILSDLSGKRKVLKKHSLPGEKSSLGLSEAVHQMVINDATPLTHPSA